LKSKLHTGGSQLGEVIKKGNRKLRIGLAASIIVIVVLAGVGIWFYMNKTSLELQLKERWDLYGSELWWHSYYQNLSSIYSTWLSGNITAYQQYVAAHSHMDTDYNALQSTYDNYVATHSHTNTEYDNYVATHHHTDSEYDALQSEYNDYKSTHSHTDTDYDAVLAQRNQLQIWLDGNITYYTSQITYLQAQIADLNSMLNLEKSTIWVSHQTVSQPRAEYSSWTNTTSYAGYISVNVESSTTEKTWVWVIYSSHGVSYSELVDAGSGGIFRFPVLPSSIEIRVGNSNTWPADGATETVTITYYF
jgi:hypothetical protein